jgi:antitoxin component HigA of HigAB toxin-antitoxin module
LSEIKPIRSEADYETALAEVERLWGAILGTILACRSAQPRRGLSINMIRRLHDKLGISAETLIRQARRT